MPSSREIGLDWAAGWILPLGAMTLLPLKKDLQVLRKLGQAPHWSADNRSSVLQKYQHRLWSTQPCLMEIDCCHRRFLLQSTRLERQFLSAQILLPADR